MGGARFYWEDPNGASAFAGAGAAVELMAWGPQRFQRIASDARELFEGSRLEGDGNRLAVPV